MNVKGEKETSGFDASVGVTRYLLKTIGIWPEKYNQTSWKCRFYAYVPPTMIILFLIIPQLRKLSLVRDNFIEITDILAESLVVICMCLVKYFGIWFNQKDLQEFVIAASNDWRHEDQEILWRNAKISKSIILAFTICNYSNATFLTSRAVAGYYIASKKNVTLVRPMLVECDFYMNHQISPVYEICLICQCVSYYLAVIAYSGHDGFFMLAISHYTGLLHNLQLHVQELREKQMKFKCTFTEILKPVIQRHRFICKYTSLIERNFNKVFLVQILASSILLCLQLHLFFITNQDTSSIPKFCYNITYILPTLLTVFSYCYISEQLRTESQNLFDAMFKMTWYELTPSDVKLLLIFMHRTRKPIEITVGKFSALSYEYFCSVIKTAAGYLSMLIAIRGKLQVDN